MCSESWEWKKGSVAEGNLRSLMFDVAVDKVVVMSLYIGIGGKSKVF